MTRSTGKGRGRGGSKKRGPKRDVLRKEEDLAKMAQLMRRGATQAAVARELGVHPTQISKDWRNLLGTIRKQRDVDAKEKVAMQLEQLAEVKKEAWQLWDLVSGRTLNDITLQLIRQIEEAKEEGQPLPTDFQVKLKSTPSTDALNTIMNALKAERDLEGLDAPVKGMPTGGVNFNFWNVLAGVVSSPPAKTVEDKMMEMLELKPEEDKGGEQANGDGRVGEDKTVEAGRTDPGRVAGL